MCIPDKRLGMAAGLLLTLLAPSTAFARIESNLAFSPAAVPAGSPARATILVQNSDAVPGSDLAFALTMPEGLNIHGSGNLASTCAGAPVLTESSGHISISLNGGQVPAAEGPNPGSCSLSFDVTGSRLDTFTMEIPAGAVRAVVGGAPLENGTPAQSSLDVSMTPIAISVDSPNGRDAKNGQVIDHRYRFYNYNGIAVTGVGFTLDMSVLAHEWAALSPVVSNTCGGTFQVSLLPPVDDDHHEATLISFRGGTIPARSSCELVFPTTPNRKMTSQYRDFSTVRQLPAELISTDQGITSAVSSAHNTRYVSGIRSAMNSNGALQATVDVLSREEADVTVELRNYNLRDIPGLTVPIRIPAGLEVVSMTTDCGSLAPNGPDISWEADLPSGPPEPQEVLFTPSSCFATLRVRANSAGNHRISLQAGTHDGYHITGSTLAVSANDSPLSASASFDQEEISIPDSAIFRVELTNKLATESVENVSFTNLMHSQMNGTLIGVQGLVENTCQGGAPSIAADRTSITVSGITLPPAAGCVLAYQITFGSGSLDQMRAGAYPKTNTIRASDITYRSPSGGQVAWQSTAGDTVTVTRSVEFSGSFSPNLAAEGSRVRLRYQVKRNNPAGYGLRDMGINLELPDGVVIDANPAFNSSCGGSLISQPGDGTFHAEGAQLLFATGQDSGFCNWDVYVRLPSMAPDETSRRISWTVPDELPSMSPRQFWAQDQFIDGTSGFVASQRGATMIVNIARYSLGLGLEFGDAAVGGSGATRVVVSLSNQANSKLELTEVGLDLDLAGSGVSVAAVADPVFQVKSGAAAACRGARFEPMPNGLRLSGAIIAPGAICQMEFSVTASSGGNHIISIPARAVTSNEAVTNPSGVFATLTVGYLLSAGIGFDPNVIAEGGKAELIIEIINTLTDDGKSDYRGSAQAITYDLPDWALVDGSPATSCAGATADLTEGNLILRDGIFPASSSCRISVPIRIQASGGYEVVLGAGAIQTLESVTNTAELTAALRVLKAPALGLAEAPRMLGTGRIGTAQLRLRNPNSSGLNPEGFTSVSLRIDPEAPLEFAKSSIDSSCSGFTHTEETDGSLRVSGIALPAGGSCTITLAARAAAPGLLQSIAEDLQAGEVELPATPPVLLSWRVVADPVVRITPFGEAPDTEVPFGLAVEIENPNEVPIALGTPGLKVDLPEAPGTMVLGDTVEPVLAGCGDAVLDAVAGGDALALSGGSLPAGGICRLEVSLVGHAGGDYAIKPAPLALEYGSLPLDPVTVTLLATHADLTATRSMRVLARKVDGEEACGAIEEAEVGVIHALPGACIEVTVTIRNPASERKAARDIQASEVIAENLTVVSIEKGDFDVVATAPGSLSADLSAIAPGETRSFSYRALLN